MKHREVRTRRERDAKHLEALRDEGSQRLAADLNNRTARAAAGASAGASTGAAASSPAPTPPTRAVRAGGGDQLHAFFHDLRGGRPWEEPARTCTCATTSLGVGRGGRRRGRGRRGAVHAAERAVVGAVVQLELSGGSAHEDRSDDERREGGGDRLGGHRRNRGHRRAAGRRRRGAIGARASGGRERVAVQVTFRGLKEEEQRRREASRWRDEVARGGSRGGGARRLLPNRHEARWRRRLGRRGEARLGGGEHDLRAGGHGRRRRGVRRVGRLRSFDRRRRGRRRRRRRLHLEQHVPAASGIVREKSRARSVTEENGESARAGSASALASMACGSSSARSSSSSDEACRAQVKARHWQTSRQHERSGRPRRSRARLPGRDGEATARTARERHRVHCPILSVDCHALRRALPGRIRGPRSSRRSHR